MAEIKYIPIGNLHGHPGNPRKDIGDVTELADSIKVKGVLQNLTVVPLELVDPDATLSLKGDHYTVIIGHRRLAAAKLAGLKELPCAVVEMSEEDQLATMLVENMQRSDLTLYEEAKGFQTMLDLGKTVAEVADMSGFSQTTVRRRAKLAALDDKKFKTAVDRGATLFDFAELDKIESPEARDKLLDEIGTRDFKNALKTALKRQKDEKVIAGWVGQIAQWAVDIGGKERKNENGNRFVLLDDAIVPIVYVKNYSIYGTGKVEIERPGDADTSTYFYIASSYEVSIYKKLEQADQDAQAAKEAERKAAFDAHDAKLKKFKEMSERHRALRFDFAKNFNQFQKRSVDVWELVTDAMVYAWRTGGGYYNNDSIKKLGEILGVAYDNAAHELEYHAFLEAKRERPEQTALLTAMWILDRGDYFTERWDNSQSKYVVVPNENKGLDALYRLLGSLGYLSSTEEVELRHGTHKLFDKASET